jgi:hypothetical protein
MGHPRGPQIGVSAGVLAIATATLFALGGFAYLRGRALDPSERFFQEAVRGPSAGEGALAADVEYALFSSEHNDLIFVGDSACADGVDPLRLRRLTGLESYNFAVPGGLGARTCLLAIRGYLARHPRPKAVVLCLSPLGLETDSGACVDEMRRINTYYGLEIDGVVPLSESVPYLVRAGVQALWPHPDYRALPLGGAESETYFTQRPSIVTARGFHGLPDSAPVRTPPAESGVLIREDWDHGVHEMADTCAAAGVHMLILFAPLEDTYKDARDFNRLDRWGRELEKAYPNLSVRRPILLAYEPRLMWDAIHLNSHGVEKFTPVVVKAVQEALAK